ncbi:c-type cytochrome [Ramlibacter rhizophilus]|uniref:C-type cytochrome n=1 Tax=Ramlibacter rhizophilus TaxID=1781167 RepID=A0A4Z0BPY8_9BURK|nr:c-type cytochrome [Ramlibacter rhizophilus]TFZ01386.1 c-type cytochrome [Ramlibacter rhizophilus]
MTLRIRLRTLGLALLAVLAVAGLGAWLFVFYGLYNVAASRQHYSPVYSLLNYALHRSIAAESRGLEPPPNLVEAGRIRSGVALYQAHCLQCHGAPGVSPSVLAFGMTPEPVNLMPSARAWPPEQIFWTIKHGIKMSGMPAWEWRMPDEQIWDLTAFVKAMAVMSPRDYAQLVGGVPDPGPGRASPSGGRQPAATSTGAGAGWRPRETSPQDAGLLGDPRIGREKVGSYLCATCHVIPGMTGATRSVGPPLNGIGTRTYIAGVIRNRPENMVRFLLNPQQVDPLSAMPPLGLSEQDARDVAAFLYTLRTVE